MNDQTQMPPAHRNAPIGTSHVAAQSMVEPAKTLRDTILTYIDWMQCRGVTDDEGELMLGIKPQTYTPRRGELVKLGLVVDSGMRRKTDAGRPAAVWVTPQHMPKRDKPE